MPDRVIAIDRSPDLIAKYYTPVYLTLAEMSKRVRLQVVASLNDKRYGFKHPFEWYPRNRFEEYCYRNLCKALKIDVHMEMDWFNIATSRIMRISKHNKEGK